MLVNKLDKNSFYHPVKHIFSFKTYDDFVKRVQDGIPTTEVNKTMATSTYLIISVPHITSLC